MGVHAVLGCTGQVGAELGRQLTLQGETWVGTGYSRPGMVQLDLGDQKAVGKFMTTVKPDTVWLVGAYTHVDGCEAEPGLSERVNRGAAEAVARWASTRDARVRFFSTDYVFDGHDGPYDEAAVPRPLSVYGLHKRQAEETLMTALPHHCLILRTAWVYSWETEPKNFMQRLVVNLRQGHPAIIPHDQWGNPTYASDLVRASLTLDRLGHAGLFHVAGSEVMSRLAFAHLIAQTFNLPSQLVQGISTAQLQQKAPRPLKAGLMVDKLTQALGWAPRPPLPVLTDLAQSHPSSTLT